MTIRPYLESLIALMIIFLTNYFVILGRLSINKHKVVINATVKQYEKNMLK